jgi:uncharacterized membrane protein YccC
MAGPLEPDGVALDRHRRQRLVMGGLLLTLVGFFLLWVELPSGPGQLPRVLPVVGAAAVALWAGGIVLGNTRRPFWRRRSG